MAIQVNIHNPVVSSVNTFFDSAVPFVTVKMNDDEIVLFFQHTSEVEALRDNLDYLLGMMYRNSTVSR